MGLPRRRLLAFRHHAATDWHLWGEHLPDEMTLTHASGMTLTNSASSDRDPLSLESLCPLLRLFVSCPSRAPVTVAVGGSSRSLQPIETPATGAVAQGHLHRRAAEEYRDWSSRASCARAARECAASLGLARKRLCASTFVTGYLLGVPTRYDANGLFVIGSVGASGLRSRGHFVSHTFPSWRM